MKNHTFWAAMGALLIMALMVGSVQGDILPDPTAVTTIPTLDPSDYEVVVTAIGGESNTTATIDWWALIATSNNPYALVFGNMTPLMIFMIPFVMMWIRQAPRGMVISGGLGIIFGSFILRYLPAQWHLGAIAAIALSILGIIFAIIKERK